MPKGMERLTLSPLIIAAIIVSLYRSLLSKMVTTVS